MDHRKLQILEEKDISRTMGMKRNGSNASMEERNYNLNTNKSMEKKLESTTRCDMEITDTGGGIKLSFTAGTYELIKFATDKLFTQEDKKEKCERIPVVDKKGNLVETKYKVITGKHSHYCLNMYHTKCACLVNGKGTLQFMQADIHDIFSVIQNKLTDENCSLSDFNNSVKELIIEYCNLKNEYDNNEKDEEKTVMKELQSRSTSQAICQPNHITSHSTDIAETTEIRVDTNESTSCVNTDTKMYDMLQRVQTAVTQVQNTLDEHIGYTNIQFTQIRDEMSRIRKQSSLNNNSTDEQIESLSYNTKAVRTDIDKFTTTIQKQLQTMFESLKTLHLKTTTNNRTAQHNSTTEKAHAAQTIQTDRLKERVTDNIVYQENINRENVSATNKNIIERSGKKTLLIGSSILKGINLKGLHTDVTVSTNSGAGTQQILTKLMTMDITAYQNIVVYIGGNDLSSKISEERCSRTLEQIIEHVIGHQGCTLYLCTLCPRKDADVIPFNDYIKQLAEIYGIHTINIYSSFVYENGKPVNSQFLRDKIHLNRTGSSILVGVINNSVQIIKPNRTSSPRKQRMPYSTTNTRRAQPNYQDWTYPSHKWIQQRSPQEKGKSETFNGKSINHTPHRYNRRRTDSWNNTTTRYQHW